MSVHSKLPELQRDALTTVTNLAAVAIVALSSAGLWMLVR